jgi:DNA-binding NtrC family response regulator
MKKQADVLIVDDEPDICWTISRVLEAAGLTSTTTTSGQTAMHLARKGRFKLAFVDAKLPDADGLDLARRLREVTTGLCIVLFSGYFYGNDAEVRQAVSDGVIDHFLSKPIHHADVRAIAAQALLAPGPGHPDAERPDRERIP